MEPYTFKELFHSTSPHIHMLHPTWKLHHMYLMTLEPIQTSLQLLTHPNTRPSAPWVPNLTNMAHPKIHIQPNPAPPYQSYNTQTSFGPQHYTLLHTSLPRRFIFITHSYYSSPLTNITNITPPLMRRNIRISPQHTSTSGRRVAYLTHQTLKP